MRRPARKVRQQPPAPVFQTRVPRRRTSLSFLGLDGDQIAAGDRRLALADLLSRPDIDELDGYAEHCRAACSRACANNPRSDCRTAWARCGLRRPPPPLGARFAEVRVSLTTGMRIRRLPIPLDHVLAFLKENASCRGHRVREST